LVEEAIEEEENDTTENCYSQQTILKNTTTADIVFLI
jgi:hypothetical protein